MSNANGESDVNPTESETTGTVGNFSHGSRETPAISASPMEADRLEKARCHKSNVHVAGESDSSIVPEKPANKGGVPLPAESAEGRGLTAENTGQSLLDRTQGRNSDGIPFVLATVGAWLQSVLRGWCQYYAVPGNYARLRQFREAIQVMWLRTLRRRSQRGLRLTWEKFSKLSKRWLPTPKILHPYPNVRFARQHPR